MENKRICCCGPGGWTQVIAYLQMFGAVSSSYSVTFSLARAIALLSMDLKNPQHPDGSPLKPEEIQVYKAAGITSLVFSIIMLLYAILNFIMGFILLRGSTYRSPRQIHFWIGFTVISITVWLVRVIFECYMYSLSGRSSASEGVPILMGIIALVLAIHGFFLWVSTIQKKEIEIEASTGPALPVI